MAADMNMANAEAAAKPFRFLTPVGEAARRHGHLDVLAHELIKFGKPLAIVPARP